MKDSSGPSYASAPIRRSVLFAFLLLCVGGTSVRANNFGGFTTDVPISVPKFHDIEPNLSLVYQSSPKNTWVGVGWGLTGVSSIERAHPGGGVPNYNTNDTFFLDGMELVSYTALGGTHATTIQNYSRITRDVAADQWRVVGTNGNVATYTPEFRVSFGPTQQTFRWLLKTISDPHGNTVTYNYWEDNVVSTNPNTKNVYLDNIQYNGTTITFLRGTRSDPFTFPTGGTVGKVRHRLEAILIREDSTNAIARIYDLQYATSTVSERALLTHVQQWAGNAQIIQGNAINGDSLPAMTLDYYQASPAFLYHNAVGPTGVDLWGSDRFTWAADFNGDGRTDMASGDGHTVRMKRSTGINFSSENWSAGPFDFSGPNIDPNRTWVGDFNGDGKADIATANGSFISVLLSTGWGFNAFDWQVTPNSGPPAVTPQWGAPGDTWVGDFNGDGKTDITSLVGNTLYLFASTGTGFTQHTTSAHQWGPDRAMIRAGDFNGDGKTDLASPNGAFAFVHISVGNDFTSQAWSTNGWGDPEWTRVGDFNGDGLADIASRDPLTNLIHTHINVGPGFKTVLWSDWIQGGNWGHELYTWTGDFNGDGITDWCTRDGGNLHFIYHRAEGRDIVTQPDPGTVWGHRTYCRVGDFTGDGRAEVASPLQNDIHLRYNNGPPTDLMQNVHNGTGGSTTVQYVPSSWWTNDVVPLGFVIQTVLSLTTKNNFSPVATTSYSYEGAKWSFEERRFQGFRKVSSALDAEGAYTETEYLQAAGQICKPLRVASMGPNSGPGGPINYSETTYQYDFSGTAPYTSLLSERRDFTYNYTTSRREILTQFAYDVYGNVVAVIEHGDTAVAGDERYTQRSYAPNTTDYLVGFLAYELIYDGATTAAPLLEARALVYDGANTFTAPPVRGDMTLALKFDDLSSNFVTTAMSYDSVGNLVSETDERGFTATIAYDPVYNVYPVSATNALGHTTTRTWDTVLGVETSTTDPNGAVTSSSHDSFGRVVAITYPDGSVTTSQYVNWGNPTTQHILESKPDGTPDGLWTRTYFDGLGRAYEIVQEGNNGANIVQETVYVAGTDRVFRQSYPYRPGQTKKWIQHSYDGVGRRAFTSYPDGTSSAVIHGMDSNAKPYEIHRDQAGNDRTLWRDAYGNLVRVREDIDGQPFDTTYEYDGLDRLVRTVDSQGNVGAYTYDSLGRKIVSQDPDLGIWFYYYDAAGNQLAQLDSRGNLTLFAYDALGRMTQKQRVGSTTDDWYYDEPTSLNSIGRVTRRVHAHGSETFSYDIRGQMNLETRTVLGDAETFGFIYDGLGRIETMYYPDGDILTHNYDNEGRLQSVSGFVNSMTWSAQGQLQQIVYANGATSDFTYDPNRLWLVDSEVTTGGQTLYQCGYSYDAAARITATTSTTNPMRNLAFNYDSIGRLRSTSASQVHAYDYDSIGNLTNKDGTAYQYGSQGPVHAPQSVGGETCVYDAAGNLQERGNRAYAWDQDNQLASSGTIVGGTPKFDTAYGYDSHGNRVFRQSDNETTRYFGAYLSKVGTTTAQHYYAGPLRVAKKEAGVTEWYHSDHLSSVSLITDAAGQVSTSFDYAPYGEVVQQTGSTNNEFGFNGHVQDVDSQLVYMVARYYDADLGRFISPDTIVPNPADPQALNRYAFGYNNPVVNTDPTGHAPVFVAVLSATLVTAAKTATGWLVFTAWVGAGASVVGYYTDDPILSSIGAVLLGFAGGYTAPGAKSQALSGIIGGTGAAATSPLSPLDTRTKTVVGWAFRGIGGLARGQGSSDNIVPAILHEGVNAAKRIGFSRLAASLGVDPGEINAALTVVSFIGNETVGSRFHDEHASDGWTELWGFQNRGGFGVIFDTVDLALGFQGLPSASEYEFMFSAHKDLPLHAHSLGALGASNLAGLGIPRGSVTVASLPIFNAAAPGVEVHNGFLDVINGGPLGWLFSPFAEVQQSPDGWFFHRAKYYSGVRIDK